jgi:hypothetical protein
MNLNNLNYFGRNFNNAFIAALALLSLFLLVERILALMFFTPAKSRIVLTEPPATNPRPPKAGFI